MASGALVSPARVRALVARWGVEETDKKLAEDEMIS